MPKLLSSISILLACVVCGGAVVANAGQKNNRPHTESAGARRKERRAPVVFLDSTKEADGLKGPVRRVETEITRMELKDSKPVSKSRSLLERTLYDERGRRIENETYPVVGSQVGQEAHKYDAQGNLAETVNRDARGNVLSRTVYNYILDNFGNWTQMTASVVVSNAGQVEYEPTEITNRTITYYLTDEAATARQSAPVTDNKNASVVVAPSTAQGIKVSERARANTEAKPPERSALLRVKAEAETIDVGVLNGRTTVLPKPAFPGSALRLEHPVIVTVEVTVDITGRVVSASAWQNAPDALRKSAETAARRAVFLPFYVGGHPVRVKGMLQYKFEFLP